MKPDKYRFLLIAALISLAACSEGGGKKKSEPPPVPATTALSAETDFPVMLSLVGRAEAFESVALKSRVDGQVAAVLFTEGQRVKQGDVLLRLDPTDFAARLRQAEAAVARDEALIAKAQADTTRYTALKERNFISEEKVNDVRTSEASASANLRASKAAAEIARLQLGYTTVRAPFSGVVGARVVYPGSSVKINETVLAVVNRSQPLLVNFSVPEKHLAQIRSAVTEGAMRVTVGLPNDPSRRFDGKVRFVDNAVDTATGTILMKAELPNGNDELTPGQFLNVSLRLNTLAAAVTVPNAAVQQGPEGNFVFVVNQENRVELRPVVIAATHEGNTALQEGIKPGETVVTDGHLRLAPGVRIRPGKPDNNAQTSAAPSTDKP